MKLSIIVPVYNVAQWLTATVNCILQQTFQDFELILIDDGSTDGSGTLCDTFASSDKRVYVLHQKNTGVSAARNAGLDAAQGEYIAWVDSDDIIEADMFQHLISLAENHNADIVQCQHDRACILNNIKRTNAISAMEGTDFVRRIFTKHGAAYTNQVALWSKIYHRTLWEGIRFPVGRVYEDEMQTYKVCLKAKKIIETQDILYHYIKRENSIITETNHRKLLDKQTALADRLNYLPGKLPDLESVCNRTFLEFSKKILILMYQQKDNLSVQRGIVLLLSQHAQLKHYANKYDRIYLYLLNTKLGKHWVLSNNFEPIQKMIRWLKH